MLQNKVLNNLPVRCVQVTISGEASKPDWRGENNVIAHRPRLVLFHRSAFFHPVNEVLGLKDYELFAYFAAFAPAGTPADVVVKLNGAFNAAAQTKDLQDKFAPIGFAVDPGTPAALADRTKVETAKWAKAIREAKIEPQ